MLWGAADRMLYEHFIDALFTAVCSTFDASGNGVYSTSKWAVESISKCVAMTLPPELMCAPPASRPRGR